MNEEYTIVGEVIGTIIGIICFMMLFVTTTLATIFYNNESVLNEQNLKILGAFCNYKILCASIDITLYWSLILATIIAVIVCIVLISMCVGGASHEFTNWLIYVCVVNKINKVKKE